MMVVGGYYSVVRGGFLVFIYGFFIFNISNSMVDFFVFLLERVFFFTGFMRLV